MNPMQESLDKVFRSLYGEEILKEVQAMRPYIDQYLKEHPSGYQGDSLVSYLVKLQEERDSKGVEL